jgi:CRISPR-associated DxTHG motif protein
VLLTILGVAPKPAEYALFDQRHEARLAPVALFHLLPAHERPDVVAALCTKKARAATFPELESLLSSANVTVRYVPLPMIGEDQDVGGFLTAMVSACEDYPDATLMVDVTHGFRHLSFLMYIGALYLSALGKSRLTESTMPCSTNHRGQARFSTLRRCSACRIGFTPSARCAKPGVPS